MANTPTYLTDEAMDDLAEKLYERLLRASEEAISEAMGAGHVINRAALETMLPDRRGRMKMALGLGFDIWSEGHAT